MIHTIGPNGEVVLVRATTTNRLWVEATIAAGAGLATEATLAALKARADLLATEATAAALKARADLLATEATLSALNGKVTACNTGAVTVSASALPSGAATEATLSALNGKVTACNTGAVTVSSSALPSGAATEATLSALNGKVTACNTGSVTVAASALPSGAATSTIQTDGTQKTIVRGGAKGATTAADVTSESGGTAAQALHVYNMAPMVIPGNYSTSRGDGSAIRASDVTITFTGATIVSSQIRRVMAFIDASTRVLVWEQGANAIISISGTTITVTPLYGVAAPIPATTTLVVVDWIGPDKGIDSTFQGMRVIPMWSDRSFRQTDPISVISAAQNITNAWADLGPEWTVDGANSVVLTPTIDINTCTDVRFRALYKHTSAGAGEFMLPIKNVVTTTPFRVEVEGHYYEYNIDGSDFSMGLDWDLMNCIKYVQFQVMCGTVPGAAGQVLSAEVMFGW